MQQSFQSSCLPLASPMECQDSPLCLQQGEGNVPEKKRSGDLQSPSLSRARSCGISTWGWEQNRTNGFTQTAPRVVAAE